MHSFLFSSPYVPVHTNLTPALRGERTPFGQPPFPQFPSRNTLSLSLSPPPSIDEKVKASEDADSLLCLQRAFQRLFSFQVMSGQFTVWVLTAPSLRYFLCPSQA
ncbi:hypothetical protein AMECASPLE_030499 [Ameca splendens]|uniref:Uncharacterized protein n=1 Tax=Ameca splendens TaxID=208324 RepID=A0ABV1ACD3_9TELE